MGIEGKRVFSDSYRRSRVPAAFFFVFFYRRTTSASLVELFSSQTDFTEHIFEHGPAVLTKHHISVEKLFKKTKTKQKYSVLIYLFFHN